MTKTRNMLFLVQQSINIEFTLSKKDECLTFTFFHIDIFFTFSIIESDISYTTYICICVSKNIKN